MTQRQPDRGFTLLELLVVLVVIGVCCCLLLPAVQRARVQARHTQCMNNLKIIGLAMHNYHDTHLMLPPGWVTHTPYAQSPSGYGWQVMILPFVEQWQLFDRLQLTVPFGKEAFDLVEQEVLQTDLSVYRCPSDRFRGINPLRDDWGATSYSGNYGTQPIPRMAALTGAMFWPGALPTLTATDGAFWWNSNARFRDFIDGTSNTILIGEKCWTSAGGIWPGVRSNSTESDVVTDMSVGRSINGGRDDFSSPHRGGANFLFVDGSVQFLVDAIASRKRVGDPDGPGLFQLLGSRNDGTGFRWDEVYGE